jgi:predicted transcriptional regulator
MYDHIMMENHDTATMINETKSIMRRQYRTAIGIAGDILQICISAGVEGAMITTICRQANLSHYAVLDNCQKLIDAGLIQNMRVNRNLIFKITNKGRYFFQEFQRFQALVKDVNLRY